MRSRTRPPAVHTVPSFNSGIIDEPLLHFGGKHAHVDPKTGLALYGPYSMTGQARPQLTSICVGMVGPASAVADAEQWLQACRGIITNDGSEPFLYPHFPGFNERAPFNCDIMTGDAWREPIKDSAIADALEPHDFHERVRRVVALYVTAIQVLSERDPKPQVILCCMPQAVLDRCTIKITRGGVLKIPKPPRVRRSSAALPHGQLGLFAAPLDDADDDGLGAHHNLRRGIKAEAMRFGIPTQLVRPATVQLAGAQASGARLQDGATRAWNFLTALYHKAGGSPWRLADLEPGTCFVGISFFREILEKNPMLRTSMAQAFTAAGDGYVLRGNSFEWDEQREGRSPHLDEKGARALLAELLELYKKQTRGGLPTRLVVHKSSRYTEQELAGFREACSDVPSVDLVTLGSSDVQFYRAGDYPPLRGSYVKFSNKELLLYTMGYVPFLKTYPGPRVPWPLQVMEHHGDSPWDVVLREILALTKMNWNTADFSCGEPVTLAFSRRVGHILAEVPPDLLPRAEYRFYM